MKTLARAARRDAAAREAADRAREAFLAELDSAYTSGATVRELAAVTGFSFQRVYQLVTRAGGPGARRPKVA